MFGPSDQIAGNSDDGTLCIASPTTYRDAPENAGAWSARLVSSPAQHAAGADLSGDNETDYAVSPNQVSLRPQKSEKIA